MCVLRGHATNDAQQYLINIINIKNICINNFPSAYRFTPNGPLMLLGQTEDRLRADVTQASPISNNISLQVTHPAINHGTAITAYSHSCIRVPCSEMTPNSQGAHERWGYQQVRRDTRITRELQVVLARNTLEGRTHLPWAMAGGSMPPG